MPYADYMFYTAEFYGNVIPDEDSFRRCAQRASEYIDSITFDRIDDKVYRKYNDKICCACCSLADFIYTQENTGKAASGISSEKSGSYSVTYSGISEEEIKRKQYNIVSGYLGTTGLLYRGC